VQLMPSELVATVPTALLGPELAKYGQPVDWVVRRRPDGTRYQVFEPRVVGANPILPEIEDLLSVIEQHQREEGHYGRHKPDGALLRSSDIEDTYLSLRQGTDDDPIDLAAVKATAEKLGQSYDYILHALAFYIGY
jgi:hypothetical protein